MIFSILLFGNKVISFLPCYCSNMYLYHRNLTYRSDRVMTQRESGALRKVCSESGLLLWFLLGWQDRQSKPSITS